VHAPATARLPALQQASLPHPPHALTALSVVAALCEACRTPHESLPGHTSVLVAHTRHTDQNGDPPYSQGGETCSRHREQALRLRLARYTGQGAFGEKLEKFEDERKASQGKDDGGKVLLRRYISFETTLTRRGIVLRFKKSKEGLPNSALYAKPPTNQDVSTLSTGALPECSWCSSAHQENSVYIGTEVESPSSDFVFNSIVNLIGWNNNYCFSFAALTLLFNRVPTT